MFRTRIENTRHGASIGLDERSTGFIWFFSFLTWFSEVKREHGDNLVILLDEPGLALHATAQADLLRFVREKLVPEHQVIYTTHSPFMIDASDLFSCRTVEDQTGPGEEVLGTKVGDDVLSTDRDTLFPLRAALGYELSQPLFVGQFSLLVEGPSDLLYLQWFSDKLAQQRRTYLDRRWTITPCGGLKKVHTFMSLFGANGLHMAVLTDYGTGDKRAVGELRDSDLMRDGHVFTADMFIDEDEGDIEDIIGRDNYSVLVKQTYKLTVKQALPKKRPEKADLRVTKEVARHFSTLPPTVAEYDHFAPARFLVTQGGEEAWPVLDGALERFERLFRELNALLL